MSMNTRYIRSCYTDCALRVATAAECAEYDADIYRRCIWVTIDDAQYEVYID